MPKTATIYAETAAVLIAFAAAAHYLAGLDWPWAIAGGAALSVIVRGVLRRRAV